MGVSDHLFSWFTIFASRPMISPLITQDSKHLRVRIREATRNNISVCDALVICWYRSSSSSSISSSSSSVCVLLYFLWCAPRNIVPKCSQYLPSVVVLCHCHISY